ELYHQETSDLIEAYLELGIVGRVDGTGAIDDITERLLQTIYNIRARTGTLPAVKPRNEK
ncbi:MAG: adenylate kinase, partial [Yaniella sp.]|nr:adenylate kinase [Yaniella sp.]